ncbi:phage terminase large subunit [Novosphingobium umbonatum]|uniref:phage terminase large subunit n=1 Tax=Novosphingobium umbonatum TaxID=1908524 RepID=UPI0024827002|nr:phage terminase large subunit [Novosphingobium umbonatum]
MTQLSSKEQLQENFLKFIWYVWKYVMLLPQPTRVQLDVARYLQLGPARRFIQAFRGVGKSFLTCAYVVWRLWKDPQLKVVIVSANETLATECATLIKQIIEHSAGDGLWDELRPKMGQRTSALAFDVGPAVPDKSPSVKVVGIFGQLTGSRADLLISDDVEVPKNAETESMREKLEGRTAEYAAILKPDGEIVYLGTPQSQESIYRRLPEKGYEVRIWPARYPTADRFSNYKDHLAPILKEDMERDPSLCKPVASTLGGKPTDPARFSELDLMSREQELRAAAFLLQMQLDTSLSDADKYPLKTKDLMVMDIDRKIAPVRVAWGSGPELALKDLANVGFDGDRLHRPMYLSPEFSEFTGSVLHVDPSGRGKDETAYCVTKFLNGVIYVRQWGGLNDGYADSTLHALAKIAADEEVNLVVTESNFGDGMFNRLLEPVLARYRAVPVEEVKSSGQKELRILSLLEPLLAQHRLAIDTSVVRKDLAFPDTVKRGLYQLTHLTAQRGALKHDDRLDVLALAAAYWTQYLNRDQMKAEEDWKRREEAKWEKEFFSGTIIKEAPVEPAVVSKRAKGRISGRGWGGKVRGGR